MGVLMKNEKLFKHFVIIMPICLIAMTHYFVDDNTEMLIIIVSSMLFFLTLLILYFSSYQWLNKFAAIYSDITLIVVFLICILLLRFLYAPIQLILLYISSYVIAFLWYRDIVTHKIK